VRRRLVGDWSDDEVGDGEEGPHGNEKEEVYLAGPPPVRGDYDMSVRCGVDEMLYSPSAVKPRTIIASNAWMTRTGRRRAEDKAMIVVVAYTARYEVLMESL
jgi:hypothetical protein